MLPRRVQRVLVIIALTMVLSAIGLVLTPTALAAQAVLIPPHIDWGADIDGDEFFDYLHVDVSVLVSEAGIFKVEARGSWHPYASAVNLTVLQTGFQTVSLIFLGGLISVSGIDGPYLVELSLYDEDLDLLEVGVHTTRAYHHADFEGKPVAFTPPHTDYGLDTDGNGLFDFLVVEANVFVTDAGTHKFAARLNWTGPDAWNETRLETGPQKVTFRFRGEQIISAQLDGPYTARMAVGSSVFSTGERDRFVTAWYSHLDFDRADPVADGAAFAPPHSEFGLDTDGDGTYNYLVVAVNLEVTGARRYALHASLPLGARSSEVHNSTFLAVGLETVLLFLDGRHIRTSGTDGPYSVELNLGARRDTHVTAGYTHLEFQNATAALAPPHTDYGLDTDGNSLHDFLIVEAAVNVTQAATYKLTGSLQLEGASSCCPVWAYNATALDLGIQTISLWFDGAALRGSGIDGPYHVTLRIDAEAGFAADPYTTAGYSHLKFDGPAALLSPPHRDFGRDTDQDGRFDFLVVDARIEVQRAGLYRVSGLVSFDERTHDATQNVTWLDAGLRTVRLWLYGHRANLAGTDGPYPVRLSLERCLHLCFRLSEDEYGTSLYSRFDFEDPASHKLRSTPAHAAPLIDGAFGPGEWEDAVAVDLTQTVGNSLPSSLLVKNDDEFLYVALDAVGDLSLNALDTARIAFDTGYDKIQTEGDEDEFVQGGQAPNDQAHYVIGPPDWELDGSPYNPDLPGHQGLGSARGFGPSERGAMDHRLYEFAIPLALIGLVPGEAVGLQAGGHSPSLTFGPGLWDSATGRFSSWPVGRRGGVFLAEYVELTLADTRPAITISSPAEGRFVAARNVLVSWSASDIGTGIDRFDLSLDNGEAVLLAANARAHQFRNLRDGHHRVKATVFDASGHSRMDVVNFTVDATPPDVSVPIAARHRIFHVRDLIIFFAADDETSGVDRIEVSLDGETVDVLPGNTLGHVLRSLSDGPHTFTVTVIDHAGNSRTVLVSFTVDTNPFSPTGPYGPWPLIGIFLSAAVSVAGLLIVGRRRLRIRR